METSNTPIILDGKATSATIREEIKADVNKMLEKDKTVPGLGVILVGARRDSQTYVRMKRKACAEVGIQSFEMVFPENVSEDELIKQIKVWNDDANIHGILVQLPLPPSINENHIISSIDFRKDIDGLHPLNVASLMQTRPRRQLSWKEMTKTFSIPCTPQGCIELLDRYKISIEGKNVVVIGRSNIVGLPMSLLLLQRNATVTICHSRTINLQEKVNEADILIVAIGKPGLIRGSWLKKDAVVIDVGINSVDDASKKSGYRLVGDVNYEEAIKVVSAITPVPGGVGPMTIAMLLYNTLKAAERSLESLKRAN